MSSLDKDVETLELALRLFFQTMKRPQRWADITAKAGVDIDRPAAHILHTLMQSPKHFGIQDLANQLGIEAPSVTRTTQKLEEAGLLARLPDPLDKRAIDLFVTEKGQAVSKKIWDAQRQIMAKALAGWSVSDRTEFIKLIQRYSADLSKVHLK